MNQKHIWEILEALRGKTIIDQITLSYDPAIPERTNMLSLNLDVDINQDDTNINLIFQPKFLTCVQWPYFLAIEEIQRVTGKPKTLDIYAHQLFENKTNNFALRFNKRCLIFENRMNIEDTLFLDLQRYCEHNRIHYEVQ